MLPQNGTSDGGFPIPKLHINKKMSPVFSMS